MYSLECTKHEGLESKLDISGAILPVLNVLSDFGLIFKYFGLLDNDFLLSLMIS